jgi:uncharacterized protein YbjT (DUF2867 family)
MTVAMNRPDLVGRNIAVGGPDAVDLHELAEKLSQAWKRPAGYEH